MRDVYVKNPALGDPNSIDKQLEENGQKLDKLNAELQKYEVNKTNLTFTYLASRKFLTNV